MKHETENLISNPTNLRNGVMFLRGYGSADRGFLWGYGSADGGFLWGYGTTGHDSALGGVIASVRVAVRMQAQIEF